MNLNQQASEQVFVLHDSVHINFVHLLSLIRAIDAQLGKTENFPSTSSSSTYRNHFHFTYIVTITLGNQLHVQC